jgi:ribosomal protein L23
MEDINLNNVIIDRKQEYKYQMKVAPTVSLKDINAAIKELFG